MERWRPVPANQVQARVRQYPNLLIVHLRFRPQRFSLEAMGDLLEWHAPLIGVVRNWLSICADLVSGARMDLIPLPGTPGRIMLVGPHHTFKDLARAIDHAFARWDLAHLHEFEMPDGRRFGLSEFDDCGEGIIEYSQVRVSEVLSAGDVFEYVFDLGDNWRHRCSVLTTSVEPVEVFGVVPLRPVPYWGWGWIPDQYGRRQKDDTGKDDTEEDEDDLE